jgi:hypothetical protein
MSPDDHHEQPIDTGGGPIDDDSRTERLISMLVELRHLPAAARDAMLSAVERVLVQSTPQTHPLPSADTAQHMREQFAAAHHDGMEALKTGDYDRLGDAIERERVLIDAEDASRKSQAAEVPKPPIVD